MSHSRKCRARLLLGIACLLAASAPVAAQETDGPAGDDEAELRLGVTARPQWALHMLARTEALKDEPERAPELAALARAVEDGAGSPRVWTLIDGAWLGEDDFHLQEWLETLPLARVAGPRSDATRHALEIYMRAHASALGEYLRAGWREEHERLEGRARAVQLRLAGPDTRLLRDTLRALGLEPEGAARVELVPFAPPPGAVTYRTRSGPVSVVGEEGLDDDTLLEVTLHEAIHAFDSMAAGERADALALLRKALLDAGLDERDPRFRNAWHCLFFVHAAEMVRRDGCTAYVDYGERFGVYEKTGPVAEVMSESWPRVLDAELAVEEFIGRVVESASGAGVLKNRDAAGG